MPTIDTSEQHARQLDARDPLREAAAHFLVPADQIYLLGNSLGLMSQQALAGLQRVTAEWRELAIGGWLGGDPPWFYTAEHLGALMAPMMGAHADEVVATGTTTINIHALLSGFYQPRGERVKILADAENFPTDSYALASHLKLRDRDPARDLVLVRGDEHGIIDEQDIIDRMTDEVALLFVPTVLYRSGQLLDVGRLARAARERGIVVGLDCAHSVGVLRHQLAAWGADFAVWCSYKYLNGGPGAPAFLYVNRTHAARETRMAGWFGYVKERQFDLRLDFEQQSGAAGWQLSSPGILAAGPLGGALGVIAELGIDRIEEKSRKITEYLMALADELLAAEPFAFSVRTPREARRRGGHVALARARDATRLSKALRARGVIVDLRPPDTLRLCPSPLYVSYHEVWRALQTLREIIETGEHLKYEEAADIVP